MNQVVIDESEPTEPGMVLHYGDSEGCVLTLAGQSFIAAAGDLGPEILKRWHDEEGVWNCRHELPPNTPEHDAQAAAIAQLFGADRE